MFIFLNGNINKQHWRYWTDENLHIFCEGHTQNPKIVNVYAGILGNAIIDPLFIQEILTGDLYVQEIIDPLIMHQLETQINAESDFILQEDLQLLQQDGATLNYLLPVRPQLNDTFPNR